MSRRGSAQLLLLFFRSRKVLGWTMGMIAGVLLVAGLTQAGRDFPLLTRTGLAQVLRQSAWQYALAGLPEQATWPWTDTPAATATTKVPRLGLSASVVKEQHSSEDESLEPSQAGSAETAHAPRQELSKVDVGDRITVTGADGSSRVYRVTGRRVVDPHLAETEPGPLDGEATLVTCLPLDPLLASSLRLVIQATKVEPPAPEIPGPEQKL
jgi:hypothetical protein